MSEERATTSATVPGTPVATLAEGQALVNSNKCAICGSFLTVCWGGKWGHDGHLVRCAKDMAHQGFVENLGLTQARRRGEDLPVYIERAIDRKSLATMDMERAVNLAMHRFPAAEMTQEQAAYFLWECMRRGLDPFLGEVVPIPFGKDKSKRTIASIVTEDGALSQAARGCPEAYAGPPRTRPLLGEELKQMADALGLPEATKYVWEAKGRRKDGEEFTTWGWMTPDDVSKAVGKEPGRETPAARAPGNQARVRAVKRWVREAFPEAASRLKEFYQDQLRVADETGGVAAVQALGEIIDADFVVVPEDSGRLAARNPPAPAPSASAQAAAAPASAPARQALRKPVATIEAFWVEWEARGLILGPNKDKTPAFQLIEERTGCTSLGTAREKGWSLDRILEACAAPA